MPVLNDFEDMFFVYRAIAMLDFYIQFNTYAKSEGFTLGILVLSMVCTAINKLYRQFL